jgi:hypothetical protein
VDNGVTGRTARARARRPAPARDYFGVILAALLLVIVFAGVRAGPPLNWAWSWHGPWHDRSHGIALLAALEVICAGLLVTLRERRKRAPDPGQTVAKLRLAVSRTTVVVMVALAATLVPLIRWPKGKAAKLPAVRTGRPRTPRRPQLLPAQGSGTTADVLKIILLVVVVVIVVVLFALLLRRLRAPAAVAELTVDDDEAAALREAVEAGRLALGELSEPRMAIINCYLAMEGSLAEAGAARGAAETPDELLARSITAGLLRDTAAAELTSLFYEARFSTHPVPPSARDRAFRALDAIAADLSDAPAGRQPAARSTAP